MTPLDYYHEQCDQGAISEDPQQISALKQLQRVYYDLLAEHHKRSTFFSALRSKQLIQGVYLCGRVGIGKTFMMDCFYHSLPFSQKMRMHFYQFMRMIHQQLTELQGKKNPLDSIAKELAKKAIVLCFDELVVYDITDAMLLGRLFNALFLQKVCLVATSNTMPDELYKHGLQRERFLPAIALLKKHTEVVFIPTDKDYRLSHLSEAGIFYTPLDNAAEHNMEKTFELLTRGMQLTQNPIAIEHRLIPVKKRAGQIVWFEFATICQTPRSHMDYLAIAQQFHTILISNIPVIPPDAKDTICLFMSMVDVFYDAGTRIVISAELPVTELYQQGYKVLEYARTSSRLLEMQSLDYFSANRDDS